MIFEILKPDTSRSPYQGPSPESAASSRLINFITPKRNDIAISYHARAEDESCTITGLQLRRLLLLRPEKKDLFTPVRKCIPEDPGLVLRGNLCKLKSFVVQRPASCYGFLKWFLCARGELWRKKGPSNGKMGTTIPMDPVWTPSAAAGQNVPAEEVRFFSVCVRFPSEPDPVCCWLSHMTCKL